MSEEPTDDRRRAERVPINEEFSSDGSTWVSDLSIGGVFVHTNELLPIGMIVELRFTVLLDDPLVIEAVGKVVRHSRRPRGIGVQFSTLAPLMRERVEQVLARQRPLDSGEPVRLPDPGHAGLPEPGHLSEPGHVSPEPGHVSEDEQTVNLARPSPVGDLRLTAADDEVTKSFPRIDAPTTFFRPPPLPGKRPADEDAATSRFPVVRRKDE